MPIGGPASAGFAASDQYSKIVIEALDLHQTLNPLVEHGGTEEVCTTISGFATTKLERRVGHKTTVTNWSGENPTVADNEVSIQETLTKNKPLSTVQHLDGQMAESGSNKRAQTRHSELIVGAWTPFTDSTIDTSIVGADGKAKGSIHSDIHSSGMIDTIVKDAAGVELRSLTSEYKAHITSPDTICTRVR